MLRMSTKLLLIPLLIFLTETNALSCLSLKQSYEKTCLESEHTNYIQCVRGRMKRHPTPCDYDEECYDCECETCNYSSCGGDCDHCCNSCCSDYVKCYSNHCCHRQCHSECRTYDCRSACRISCYTNVQREKEQTREEERGRDQFYNERVIERVSNIAVVASAQEAKTNNTNAHNITTIININNVLHNNNTLDIPINLTYTNRNNISLQETETPESCCIVIGPRQCIPTQVSPFVRCFHTRSRQCGSYCSSNIVHEETRQICSSVDAFGQPTDCQQQKSYIPQPQPRCTYTSTWPYIACGIQPPAACEGCNQNQNQYRACPPQCYDDFSAGPLYRQGPFYQSGFPQIPPCMYSPQGCEYAGMMAGYGGYGMMPGAYGQTGYVGAMPMSPLGYNWNSQIVSNSQNYSNTDALMRPQIINEGNMNFVPLNQYPQGDVEIEVAVTPPENKVKSFKRGAKENHEKHHVSVVKV